ncbi:hypothetical protein CKO42_07010 [Lamprobacter modestohalophilus]|uniref:Uncharacterized protein n=1 Tax=Lamprobacter modestohalophilus TaxID=1064514 RepID=A0A9X1B3Z8_9GAMM|nr:hypothetical protein [Lamprobacter modestohalophilus]
MIIQNELVLPAAALVFSPPGACIGEVAPADLLPLMKMLKQPEDGFGKELLSWSEVASGLSGLAVAMTAAESVGRGASSRAQSRISVEDVS